MTDQQQIRSARIEDVVVRLMADNPSEEFRKAVKFGNLSSVAISKEVERKKKK